MNIALWVTAGILAAVFAGAGLMKLTQPKEKLATTSLAWTEACELGAGASRQFGPVQENRLLIDVSTLRGACYERGR